MTLHQVVVDGFRRSPATFAARVVAGNLPQQLSSFIGRDQLLADVAELLRATGSSP